LYTLISYVLLTVPYTWLYTVQPYSLWASYVYGNHCTYYCL